ncbi:hypothetical protein [Lentilactobacillus hilgardii]|uniref:hypothetical protein n=1 Tax=Lentilactobacillus hilgardii TaxID=1588 RepID=UPI0039EA1A4B
MKMPNKEQLKTVRIASSILKDIKIIAVNDHKTIKEVVEKALTRYIKENGY